MSDGPSKKLALLILERGLFYFEFMMKPILCNYYITYRCNSRCRYCDIWQNPKYKNIYDANISEINRNIKELRFLGVRFVDFTGGEPLLYQNLGEALRGARAIGLLTSVTTNGILYAARADEIKGMVSFLHFSLDTMNHELNTRIRGVSTEGELIFKNVELALRIGEIPDIIFTLSENNVQEFEDVWRFCKSNRLMLIVNPVFDFGNFNSPKIEFLNQLGQFRKRPYVYFNEAFSRLRLNGGNQTVNPRCRAVSSTVVIAPDNKLLLPCFHREVIEIPIEEGIEKIFEKEEYQNAKRNQGRFSFCQGCDINCYFDPSFTHQIDYYTILSLKAKTKYIFDKYCRRNLENFINSRQKALWKNSLH